MRSTRTLTNTALAAVAFLLTSILVTSAALADEELRGGLRVELESGEAVEMPLTALSVSAYVSGSIAEVTVEQTYENPFEDPIEAIYIFPLPEDAAVNEMVMVVGDRRIRADLQEREQARRTYEAARERGQTASLLEQERPNIFTQSVANIVPGHPIRVLISYVEQLPYADHRYHFNFPMVVGPRFIPGAPIGHVGAGVLPDTDQVPDASRITPPVLPEGIPAPYEVEFALTIEAGMAIRELVSTSHEIEAEWHDDNLVTLSLPEHQRQPNRDVVITYSLADEEPQAGVLTHYDDRGGFFAMLVEPPASVVAADIRPKELVFVIDMSGSMHGSPLDTCKEAMRHALGHLNPGDTFQVIRFSDEASAMSPEPLFNTPANVVAGIAYVDALSGYGGTRMTEGIRAALSPTPDADRMRIVLFMTDGYIGNEAEILELVDDLLGETRLFSLGVGSSVNRFLLDKLAEVGRGTVHYVNFDEPTEQVVEEFYGRIRNPILTDITVDWGGLDVAEVTPGPIPDVFEGTPLLLSGRYSRGGEETVLIRGRQGTVPVEMLLHVSLSRHESSSSAIPYIWARRQVDAIERTVHYGPGAEVRQAIVDLALEYDLLTQYTSFVAVEERIAVNGDDPLRTVAVAVPLPEGVSGDHIGAQISPDYVQPGDPELTVYAPEDAIGVTAYFPFGLVQTLDYEGERGCWSSRFLVPRDVEDGSYVILVAIERGGGQVDYEEVPLWVDSTAPVFEAFVLPGTDVSFGDVVTFEAHVLETWLLGCVEAVEHGAEASCGEVAPERIKFIRLYLPDGRIVRMEPSPVDGLRWTFDYRVRERIGAGVHTVIVEAVDVAGNTTIEELDLIVADRVVSR